MKQQGKKGVTIAGARKIEREILGKGGKGG